MSDVQPESSSAAKPTAKRAADPARRRSTAASSKESNAGNTSNSSNKQSNDQDVDLFSFLSNMHLSNSNNQANNLPNNGSLPNRKRKFLEQSQRDGKNSGSKLNGGGKGPPFHRHDEDEDNDDSIALHTPQCSQNGFDDNEEQRMAHQLQVIESLKKGTSGASGTTTRSISESDLANNFDDSLAGLGLGVETSSYVSEALMALPNLSISNSQIFKHETSEGSTLRMKDEPNSSKESSSELPSANSFGALDLSNDEAQHLPDSHGGESIASAYARKTFTGSVSQNVTQDGTTQFSYSTNSCSQDLITTNDDIEGIMMKDAPVSTVVVSLPFAKKSSPLKNSQTDGGSKDANPVASKKFEMLNEYESEQFQYILNAGTSSATKLNEPSITYLNQGQSYELLIRKSGDISSMRKKYLKCAVRICFHERRLRYMEAEQIADWKNAHPGERILSVDIPLSYGIIDVNQDPNQVNSVHFKWDPTRDTGIFIKVNCISTEFTPKKHGGEKGAPFRLQVETFEDDVRLHAGGCILQVFKMKGADRKHKQDKDKIGRRPPVEQEKYAPSYESTVLTVLSNDNIYIPPSSRTNSPPTSPLLSSVKQPQPPLASSLNLKESPVQSVSSRDGSPGSASGVAPMTTVATDDYVFAKPSSDPLATNSTSPNNNDSNEEAEALLINANVEAVTKWLSKNRYGNYLSHFRNFNGRDMLRLMKEEVISLCGLSEGIRLYNDIHLMVVAPRTTFYVGQKDANEFRALFLEEFSTREFLRRFANSIGVEASFFGRVFITGPGGIFIRMTDELVSFTKPESVFHFTLRQGDGDNVCDVVLESVNCTAEGSIHHSQVDEGMSISNREQQNEENQKNVSYNKNTAN